MKKILLCGVFLSIISSCQVKTSKSDIPTIIPTNNTTNEPSRVEPSPVETVKAAQFGIIFSGGGVRTWAYVNILKEIQKYKLPVTSVVGIEWGAIVAGVYAQNVSANEVEWELSKFKGIDDWSNYIKKIFEKKSTA